MSGEITCVDAQPARAWRFPAWTWIILHFAFVASLAVVWHMRKPWVEHFSVGDKTNYFNSWLSGGKRPLLAHADKTGLHIWDMESGQEISLLSVGSQRPWGQGTMSRDGRRFAMAFGHYQQHDNDDEGNSPNPSLVDIWDTGTGEIVETLEHPLPPGSKGSVNVILSPDGTSVMTSSESYVRFRPIGSGPSPKTAVWEIRKGKRPLLLVLLNELPLTGYSSDGGKIASGRNSERPVVYDARTGAELCRLGKHVPPAYGCFSPDGTSLLTWQEDGETVREWDARSGKLLMTISAFTRQELDAADHNYSPRAGFGYTPDGQTIFGGAHCRYRMWCRPTGQLVRDMPGRKAMCFSADARYALFIAADDTLSMEDVTDGTPIHSIGAAVRGVAFVGQDNYIGILGYEDRVYILRRRFPEWWWGHFYRPEVWAAMVLGVVWLWSVIRWARGEWRERRAAG